MNEFITFYFIKMSGYILSAEKWEIFERGKMNKAKSHVAKNQIFLYEFDKDVTHDWSQNIYKDFSF